MVKSVLRWGLMCVLLLFTITGQGQTKYGNSQTCLYVPILKGKKVGVLVNQTSVVGDKHLLDTLLSAGITVVKVFAPEHGFRGDADAGEKVAHTKDVKTGLPVVSLYGDNKKPTAEQLKGLDWVVFDVQDVGVRFYTYISTLHYLMEACAENNVPVMVLDRPNPNGDYIDGPVLEPKYKSFVGMHPIPVVHGVTIGELARMINGEKWLKDGMQCRLQVILVKNYDRSAMQPVKIKPSPNLPNDLSIRLYPSLCFFEGTDVSVGRGTMFPFQVAGFPDVRFGKFTFVPKSIVGMAKQPLHENKTCYGVDLRNEPIDCRFSLKYLIDFRRNWGKQPGFISRPDFFNLLAGNGTFQMQIESGMTEAEIRATWKPGLDRYKAMRRKYLLYPDAQ